jgi:hypothetical protein
MIDKNYRIFLLNKTSIFRTLFVAWKNQLMKIAAMLKTGAIAMLCWMSVARSAAIAHADSTLAGTWSLLAADVIHVDGTRTRDYGAAPRGLLLIDQQGHYSLQIFKAERPKFASGDKLTATQAEYEAAVLGSSTHFGTVSVDQAAGTLTFKIENASFPNWEGTEQKRKFELNGDELSYRVPPRPDGNTPISVWRRLK